MRSATNAPHSEHFASRHPSKLGLGPMDLMIGQATPDSSLEVNMSHAGTTGSASEMIYRPSAPTVKSLNDQGNPGVTTRSPLLTLAAPISQEKPRASSISRAYSVTLSKLTNSSSKRVLTSGKPSERPTMTTSKVLSSRNLNPRKRQKLPDFSALHCERKVFDDGVVVQMIRSAIPPHPTHASQMNSFPTVETHMPHLDIEFDLDESSFGFNKSSTIATLQIQIRSPSLELECPDIPTPFDGSLQTIYHSMDELELSGDLPTLVGSSVVSPFLSPVETISHVNVIHTGGPRLSVSLMPKLSPIVLSELASLGEPERIAAPRTTAPIVQTPLTPPLSPNLGSNVSLSEKSSLESTTLSSPQDTDAPDDTDRTSASIQAVAGFCLDLSVEEGEIELIIHKLDLGEASMDSISRSGNGTEVYGKERRWDSLYRDSASTLDIQGQVGQKRSVSSSSVLAPLTEADFEASFEEVFRVGLVVNYALQEGDKGTSLRTSATSPGTFGTIQHSSPF